MGVGTALSRITGVARIFALAVALGGGSVGAVYNLANTTPNIVHDLVLGGVLAATFVPVFTDRLTTRRPEEAWRAISAVITVSAVFLLVVTVLFWFLAPDIVSIYTIANHSPGVHAQQQVATSLLRWFVPQLTFYGLLSLCTALMNTRGSFLAPMFVAIANNVVVVVVMLWFHAIVPHPSLASIADHRSQLLLLGLGTTLGVAVQAALVIPAFLRTDLHLRFHWEPGHEAVRTVLRLAGWTFGLVVANQLALVVVLALADGEAFPGSVAAYTYAYTFFQLPFGVVAVSIMSAVTPGLAARWAVGDVDGFRRRLVSGLTRMLAIVVPATIGMLVLSHPGIDLILAHGDESAIDAHTTGATLALFTLGLPGFCVFLYLARALQAMQDTRTAFFLYVVENGTNIVVALALSGPLGVRGLALSVAIAYTVAAVAAVVVVGRRVGRLGGPSLTGPLRRVVGASAMMGVATLFTVNVSAAPRGYGLLLRILFAVVVGASVFVLSGALLWRLSTRRHPTTVPTDPQGPTALLGPPGPPEPMARSEPTARSAPMTLSGSPPLDPRLSPPSPSRPSSPAGRPPTTGEAPRHVRITRAPHEAFDQDLPRPDQPLRSRIVTHPDRSGRYPLPSVREVAGPTTEEEAPDDPGANRHRQRRRPEP